MADKTPQKIEDAAQRATDKAEDQGFIGVKTDPTPNENYTVAGVIAGKPTPETTKGTSNG